MEEYIKKIDATKHKMRDPIYGFIPLTENELRVIDTPLFQRLRRIHQLALTKYVYPSAEHSRFVHSLGVMHCATLMHAGVFSHKSSALSGDSSKEIIKTLRYAALLHDVGHLPFSHAVEKQWLNGLKHEDISIYIIENYDPIKKIITSDGVDSAVVASLLKKKPIKKYYLLHEILSGQLDADRADYLLRDSHCCGVKYGEYDFHRFLQIFAAREDDNGSATLFVDENDLHVAESLLIARYHYNVQIPYHRTRSGYDFILNKFIEKNLQTQNLISIKNEQIHSIDFEGFAMFDDSSIFEEIKKKYAQGDRWARYLLRQEHLTPVVDMNNLYTEGAEKFKFIVRALRNATDFTEGEDFFVQNQKVEMIKKATPSDEDGAQPTPEDAGAALPLGAIRLLLKKRSQAVQESVAIRERSWIFKRLDEEPHTIFRVYSTPEKKSSCMETISRYEQEFRDMSKQGV